MAKLQLQKLADSYNVARGLDKLPFIEEGRLYANGVSMDDLIKEIGTLDNSALKYVLAIGVTTEAQKAIFDRSRELRGA